MLQGEKEGVQSILFSSGKKRHVAGFVRIPSTGWGVMVPQPTVELEQNAQRIYYKTLAITLLSIAVAALLSWYLAGLFGTTVRGS